MNLELAWAAGFFDGEGTVAATNQWCPTVTVVNTDRELLARYGAAIGHGTMRQRVERKGNRKALYTWSCSGANAVATAEAMLPLVGTRNRLRFERIIALYAEAKAGVCEHCGESFRRHAVTTRFCSKRCSSAARRLAAAVRVPCPICGETFTRLYPETQTCSKRCAARLPTRTQRRAES